tara:strand:+ start:140 stop:535 length:396 start_codon:yes stop_codon:yes gene_type:complete
MIEPKYMNSYPKACSYILGCYGLPILVLQHLNELSEHREVASSLGCIEYIIDSEHPEWKRDEIYYRGMDLSDYVRFDKKFDIDMTDVMDIAPADRKKLITDSQRFIDHEPTLVQQTFLLSRNIKHTFEFNQ